MQLKKVAGGFPVTNEEECYNILSKLVDDEGFRKESGRKNHDFLYASKGASEKIVKRLQEFL